MENRKRAIIGTNETFVTKKCYLPDITTRVNEVTYLYNITPFPWVRDPSESGPLFTISEKTKGFSKAGFCDGL